MFTCSLSLSLHGDSHLIRIPSSTTKSMASKKTRYQLRSCSVAAVATDYDTPVMDPDGYPLDIFEPSNLSQSDVYQYSSQMENFLSESFGSRFNNMNSLNESELRNTLDAPKEEGNPLLYPYTFGGSQELNAFHPQENVEQFVPANDEYRVNADQLEEDDEYPGGFICSQGLRDQSPFRDHIFTVSVMPTLKTSNRDYLPQDDLLFVRFMTPIGLNFTLNNPVDKTSMVMPADTYIRMSLRFTSPVSDDKERVARCHVHAEKDTNGSHKTFPFIVNHRQAEYDDASLRVIFPACTVVTTTFYCYSSCAGGIDRKPVFLYFELLNADGSLCQSASWAVKVCANPSRDAPKETERRKKEERVERGRVKSEASEEVKGGEIAEKRGKKRKNDGKAEAGREVKRTESLSPMQSALTPSAVWSHTMSAPKASSSSRRGSKLELGSSSDGLATESNGNSRKTSIDEDENTIFEIKIHGPKKYHEVMQFVKRLEENERYATRNDEDNPFENLTQLTGDVSISSWLHQYGTDIDNFVTVFESMGMNTLDDVEAHFTPSLFNVTIGIPQPLAARLNKVYLNWLNVNKGSD